MQHSTFRPALRILYIYLYLNLEANSRTAKLEVALLGCLLFPLTWEVLKRLEGVSKGTEQGNFRTVSAKILS